MSPVPNTPTVSEPSSRAGVRGSSKSYPSTFRSSPFIRRSSASTAMTAYSDTALRLYNGTFAQRRPCLAAAARSMWSKPVPRVRTYLTPASCSAAAVGSSTRHEVTMATASEPRAARAVSSVSRRGVRSSSTPSSSALVRNSPASSSLMQ